MNIADLQTRFRSGELSAMEASQNALDAIESSDTNAFISVRDRDQINQEALAAHSDYSKPLAGVPIAVKDNICLINEKTTAASRILRDFVSPYSATVVKKLQDAGAIIIGKTNLDEFAMGSSNENSAFGPVKNPVVPGAVPGGSSGGSAAAVAANLCAASLGSDTGGSIRQPASFCGVIGAKPTYGRVSRYGLIAFASSLDQIGPMTHTVADCALMLNAICGHDPRDMTSSTRAVPDFTQAVSKSVKGMTIGIPTEYYDPQNLDGLHPDVARATESAIDALKSAGAEIKTVSLPHTKYAVATYYLIATAEASSNLARFDGVRYGHRAADPTTLADLYERSRSEGFGEEVKRRIMLGTYVLSAGYYDAYYKKAQCVRTLIREDFNDAFQSVDALLTPVVPTPAFKMGERTADPLEMYLADIFTISCNLAGLPGISVPFGESNDGEPIGVQVMAKPFDEETMLTIAQELERSRS